MWDLVQVAGFNNMEPTGGGLLNNSGGYIGSPQQYLHFRTWEQNVCPTSHPNPLLLLLKFRADENRTQESWLNKANSSSTRAWSFFDIR